MKKKWLMDNWSIRKKITAVFVLLVLLPAFLLGSMIIRTDIVQKHQTALGENQRILQLMSEDITAKASRVEYLIGLLVTADPVSRVFDKVGYGEYTQRLNNDVELELNRLSAYLYDLGASIMVLSNEALPERYEVLMSKSRFLPNADIESLGSSKRARWGMPGYHMPDGLSNQTFYTQKTIPYYQMITTNRSKDAGIIKCSVMPERLFEILETWGSSEPISVMLDDRVVYSTDPTIAATGMLPDPAQHPNSTLISMQIPSMGMQLVTYQPSISSSEVFSTVFLTAGLICLFIVTLLLLANLLLGRIFIGFSDINKAITAFSSGENYNFRFTKYGQDEIGCLFDAFNRLLDLYQDQSQQMIDQERNMHSAQLLALQCQMNPHFLFNALNWLQLSIETKRLNEETSDAVAHLSNVLHYNMVASYLSTVGDELNSLNEYKAFLDARYLGNIVMTIDCPDVLLQERFLRFSLQPIVENAIRHGQRDGQELHIDVSFRLRGDMIYLCVKNDGWPLPEADAAAINESLRRDSKRAVGRVGLYNLARRLHLLHQSATIEISNRDGFVALELTVSRLSEVTDS